MMRGVSTWAVAVRRPLPDQVADHGLEPDEAPLGDIEVRSFPLVSVLKRHRVLRWPIVRGVVALGESLAIGFKALGISANAQLPEGEQEIGKGTWGGTVVLAVALAVGLFFLLPAGLDEPRQGRAPDVACSCSSRSSCASRSSSATSGCISRMKDLQRVFQYHGAEHKTISCYEAGLELTPENAQRFTRLHPRCGTSFLLIVMIVAIFVFAPLGHARAGTGSSSRGSSGSRSSPGWPSRSSSSSAATAATGGPRS